MLLPPHVMSAVWRRAPSFISTLVPLQEHFVLYVHTMYIALLYVFAFLETILILVFWVGGFSPYPAGFCLPHCTIFPSYRQDWPVAKCWHICRKPCPLHTSIALGRQVWFNKCVNLFYSPGLSFFWCNGYSKMPGKNKISKWINHWLRTLASYSILLVHVLNS